MQGNSSLTFVIARQRGAVLFVALIFLVLLTLLGITASSTSILQERMTGGMRNQQLAFMGAESALRDGEFRIWNSATVAQFSGQGAALPPCIMATTSLCLFSSINGVDDEDLLRFRTVKNWIDMGIAYLPAVTGLAGDSESASLASQPRILLEDLRLDTSGYGSVKGRMSAARLQEIGGSGGAPQRRLYRVTARSQGGSNVAAVRAAESVYSAYGTNNQYNPDAGPTP